MRNDLSAGTKADLIAYNGSLTDQCFIVAGDSTIGDSIGRFYYYNPTSTLTADGELVLPAVGMGGTGRYIRLSPDIIQSDWGQSDTNKVDFIKNKPTIPAAQVQSDWNAVTGLGAILNKPTLKRQEIYSGTTNSSGIVNITFSSAFPVAPNVQPVVIGMTANQNFRLVSVSTTGCQVHVFQRNSINLLGADILLSTTVDVNNANVEVLVSQK